MRIFFLFASSEIPVCIGEDEKKRSEIEHDWIFSSASPQNDFHFSNSCVLLCLNFLNDFFLFWSVSTTIRSNNLCQCPVLTLANSLPKNSRAFHDNWQKICRIEVFSTFLTSLLLHLLFRWLTRKKWTKIPRKIFDESETQLVACCQNFAIYMCKFSWQGQWIGSNSIF